MESSTKNDTANHSKHIMPAYLVTFVDNIHFVCGIPTNRPAGVSSMDPPGSVRVGSVSSVDIERSATSSRNTIRETDVDSLRHHFYAILISKS